jgi:hypothetical protein
MRILKPLAVSAFTLLTLTLFLPAKPATAQAPAYLHAISDLRTAREFLLRDGDSQRAVPRQIAIDAISKAIEEMKIAAYRDGKDIWHPPAPDSANNPGTPFISSVKLLKEARNDLGAGYDLPENQGLRERSIKHIDDALAQLLPFL